MVAPDPASEDASELAALGRLLDVGAGTFSLGIARCDSPASRNARIAAIRAEHPGVAVVELPRGVLDPLGHARETMGRESGAPAPRALFLVGLEDSLSSDEGDEATRLTLHALNASRELWPAAFPCPVVFWLPQFAERLLCDRARDLWRWISHYFEFKDEAPDGGVFLGGQMDVPPVDYGDALNLDADIKRARIAELERRLAEPEPDDPILLAHRADWLHELGVLHYLLGELASAERRTLEALSGNRELGRLAGIAKQCSNLGLIDSARGDFGGAEENYLEALAIEEKLERTEAIANVCGNLGNLYRKMGDLVRAGEYHRRALELNERMGRRPWLAADYGNLGVLAASRGEFDEAKELLEKALATDEALGRTEFIAVHHGNLGALHGTRGDLDRAEEHFRKSLELHERIGRIEGMAIAHANLGDIFKSRGDLMTSLEHWRIALDLFHKLGALPMVERVQHEIKAAEGQYPR